MDAWVRTALSFAFVCLGREGHFTYTITCPLELAYPVYLRDLGALSLAPRFLYIVLLSHQGWLDSAQLGPSRPIVV
jgi:hypothetical protein